VLRRKGRRPCLGPKPVAAFTYHLNRPIQPSDTIELPGVAAKCMIAGAGARARQSLHRAGQSFLLAGDDCPWHRSAL